MPFYWRVVLSLNDLLCKLIYLDSRKSNGVERNLKRSAKTRNPTSDINLKYNLNSLRIFFNEVVHLYIYLYPVTDF